MRALSFLLAVLLILTIRSTKESLLSIVIIFNVLNKLDILRALLFKKRMRRSNYLRTFFSVKMAKHYKYRVLLTFDDLMKNVKNTILTYN